MYAGRAEVAKLQKGGRRKRRIPRGGGECEKGFPREVTVKMGGRRNRGKILLSWGSAAINHTDSRIDRKKRIM